MIFIYSTKDLPGMNKKTLATLKKDLKEALKEVKNYESNNRIK
jgi:hypothetical protein